MCNFLCTIPASIYQLVCSTEGLRISLKTMTGHPVHQGEKMAHTL